MDAVRLSGSHFVVATSVLRFSWKCANPHRREPAARQKPVEPPGSACDNCEAASEVVAANDLMNHHVIKVLQTLSSESG